MTTPRTAAKRERDNRLFARLIVENWLAHPLPLTWNLMSDAPLYSGAEYLQWIRAQATNKPNSRGYCYALALRAIAS